MQERSGNSEEEEWLEGNSDESPGAWQRKHQKVDMRWEKKKKVIVMNGDSTKSGSQ